eukprot:4333411-Lingulodinium_polyedra.AAC.1
MHPALTALCASSASVVPAISDCAAISSLAARANLESLKGGRCYAADICFARWTCCISDGTSNPT